MEDPDFQSNEAAQFWRYIDASLGRLMEMVAEEPEDVLRWLAPAPNPNPILVLGRHMLANVEVNICWTLGRMDVAYDREAAFGDDITREEVLDLWAELHPRFEQVLRELPQERIDGPVPHHWRGELPGREVLIIVARHTVEHLAHAELTRDMARQALGIPLEWRTANSGIPSAPADSPAASRRSP